MAGPREAHLDNPRAWRCPAAVDVSGLTRSTANSKGYSATTRRLWAAIGDHLSNRLICSLAESKIVVSFLFSFLKDTCMPKEAQHSVYELSFTRNKGSIVHILAKILHCFVIC